MIATLTTEHIDLALASILEQPKQEPKSVWAPFPNSPQEQAYNSEADVLGYGGQAGGGKSDLLLGLAGTCHRRSIIFRRVFPSLRAIIERSREIFGASNISHAKDSYNESLHIWRLYDGGVDRLIELGAMQYAKDREKQRGQPRDFIGIDEGPEFPRELIEFVIAWNRTTVEGQRCRVVITFNPPNTPEGRWIIEFFAPWLDPRHPDPALPGELRWFARIDGKDVEVADGASFEYKGETIYPRSRTFIPARLEDNPVLNATNYRSVLQSLPEPLRSQMLYGDFNAGTEDDPWQLVPTDWVLQAIERWKNDPRSLQPFEDGYQDPGPLTAVGIDVARGGKDRTVLARRYGNWFAPLLKYPGKDTPTGESVVTLMWQHTNLKHDGLANIDGIGVGTSVYDQTRALLGERAQSVMFSGGAVLTDAHGKTTPLYDRTGKLRFVRLRDYALWRVREALDPEGTEHICLPDDPQLLADLTAPRWTMQSNGVKVERKDELKDNDRLGHSPDDGDAVALGLLDLLLVPTPIPNVTYIEFDDQEAA